MRHDALKDAEANLLREVCKDVCTEPELLPVVAENFHTRTNTQPGARLDIAARGVWSTFERSFFDIRVTHPNCPSNVYKTLPQLYKEHETEKKNKYGERVLESEKGSFTPLVFNTSGGMGPECARLNKRLAELIAIKKQERYSLVMSHIRVRLRFALLRSVLIAVRGQRGTTKNTYKENLYEISFNLIPQVNQGCASHPQQGGRFPPPRFDNFHKLGGGSGGGEFFRKL